MPLHGSVDQGTFTRWSQSGRCVLSAKRQLHLNVYNVMGFDCAMGG